MLRARKATGITRRVEVITGDTGLLVEDIFSLWGGKGRDLNPLKKCSGTEQVPDSPGFGWPSGPQTSTET